MDTVDDVRRWTGDDMNVARTNAMESIAFEWKEDTTACWYSRMSTGRSAYEEQATTSDRSIPQTYRSEVYPNTP